jgi:hypothetical protein
LNRRPPWFSSWLLNYLGREDDSLAGDITQQYNQGRSRCWYWRQVMGAIVIDLVRETLENRGLVIKAIFKAWLSWTLICLTAVVIVFAAILFLPRSQGITGTLPAPIGVHLVVFFFTSTVTLKVGQIVARIDIRRQTTLVLWASASFMVFDLLRIAVIALGLTDDPLVWPVLDFLGTPLLMLLGAGPLRRSKERGGS